MLVVVLAVVALAILVGIWVLGRNKQNVSSGGGKAKTTTAPPAAAPVKAVVSAAAPASQSDFVVLRGGKKAVLCTFSDEINVVTCSADHVVRLFRERRCVAQVTVPGAAFDFVAVSGAAVFAFEGFEAAVHVLGIVQGKELRPASRMAIVAPTPRDVVRSMSVARGNGGALVGLLFASGVSQLYDARSGRLVHTVPNDKIRTNALSLVGLPDAGPVLALIATFDPACSVLRCRHGGDGAWTFERDPQLKAGQEELVDVHACAGGVVVRDKEGKEGGMCHTYSAASDYTLTRWKGPFPAAGPAGRCRIAPCGKFVCSVSGKKLLVYNKQLKAAAMDLPWSAADVWWAGSGAIVVSAAGDANVYEYRNPLLVYSFACRCIRSATHSSTRRCSASTCPVLSITTRALLALSSDAICDAMRARAAVSSRPLRDCSLATIVSSVVTTAHTSWHKSSQPASKSTAASTNTTPPVIGASSASSSRLISAHTMSVRRRS